MSNHPAAARRRLGQELPLRRGRAARARRREPRCRRGRVRRDHGLVRVGQVDADEHPGLPRSADARPLRARRPRRLATSTRGELAEVRNQHARLRVPELQPAAAHERARERRAAARLRRRAARGAQAARARGARARRARRSAATTTRRSSRAASSNASRSRARSSIDRALILADEPTGNLDSQDQHRA